MKIRFRILSTITVFSFLFYSCEKNEETFTDEASEMDIIEDIGADQAISGEYIVVFKADESFSGKSAEMKIRSKRITSRYGISGKNIKSTYSKAIQGFTGRNLSQEQVELLRKDPEVAYVEPNYILRADFQKGNPVSSLPATVQNKAATENSVLPNGEFLPWGINRVGRGNGAGRTCWVLDSGIAPHSDLNIDTNQSRSFVGGSWEDEDGHGTHVAGTIAARNNGSGVIGVAYGATVVSVRILDANGSGTVDGMIQGVDYVANNASTGETWNFSVGFRNRFTSRAIDDAFRNLERTTYGAMAAGNSDDDTQFYSPQLLRTGNSWCVGNMTNVDAPAFDSNFGRSVDRWAPGTAVWSTWLNGGFNRISGTSMASPHVAGILLLRGNSTATDGSVSKGGYSAPIATLN
ncbi:S8 family serine peptidase [Aquimarina litoralis]|uniref:S8 family serine peptidase n=1 Tax=Aquimarina litoralis TaxID=584605 RepID=UPI001C57A79F|nr:S8 family serine peptidase [Aquimarina litoralis]MBW1298571.1 S8 family serine peptidase [Aquimarina litoralis]